MASTTVVSKKEAASLEVLAYSVAAQLACQPEEDAAPEAAAFPEDDRMEAGNQGGENQGGENQEGENQEEDEFPAVLSPAARKGVAFQVAWMRGGLEARLVESKVASPAAIRALFVGENSQGG